jgi:hypothetical protein
MPDVPPTPTTSLRRVRPPADLLLDRESQSSTLVSGPWSIELRGTELDDIAYGGVPVLRSIRLVVRDEDWGTLPLLLDATDRPESGPPVGDRLELRLHGRAGTGDGIAAWTLVLRIDGSSLRVDARVELTAGFRRNRLGLVVLHPPELAGTPFVVEHPDDSSSTGAFPASIAPHQPARDIRALSWRAGAAEPVDSVLRFSGDIFEMEDQRNWTDASFKTYSTPLSEPFPVDLEPGTVIEQSVELRCARDAPAVELPAGTPVGDAGANRVRVGVGAPDAAWRFPDVSTSVSSGPVAGQPIGTAFGPLLCELDPCWSGWRGVLDRAVAEAGERPLDLRLILADVNDAIPVLDRLIEQGIEVVRIGVFHRHTHLSEPHLLAAVRERVNERGMTADILGGTRAHFTELNRNQAALIEWDGPLTFSITPFMHDRGGHQLVESIGMQRLVLRDALTIAHGRALHVGPVTLGARFNAVSTTVPPARGGDELDAGFGAEFVSGATDARQAAPSLGAWVLASVAALTAPGVTSLSYFEASGSRGITDVGGGKTAAGEVLSWLGELSGGAVASVTADHPALVGIVVGSTCVLGNLGDVPLQVDGLGEDIRLAAGAVARLELTSS